MRVRQIGSIVFDNATNVVVDATALDAAGSGFQTSDVYGPQPFAVELAFIRQTRQLALRALNTLATELYLRSQRRAGARLNVAGGVDVIVEDENGNATLRATLTSATVNLIAVENTATGVIARARVSGVLSGPFAAASLESRSFTAFKAYELRAIGLAYVDDFTLAIHNIDVSITGNTGLRNALYAFETLEDETAPSRIYRKNPTSVSSNLVLENFNAGGPTLQRARFTTSGNGTISYAISNFELSNEVFNLFFEVYLPSTPSSDVLYSISWDGQPAITGVVDFSRTFINAGVYVRPQATTVTIQITNALTNTYISPLVFIPTDGVFVYNATATNLARFFANNAATETSRSLFAAGSGVGELRGLAGFVAGKYLAVFSGMMTPSISSLDATVTVRGRRIEPASFV